MYIQLESGDYDVIAEKIKEYGNTESGSFYISDLDIEVKFSCQVEWHLEGDYESGYSEKVVDSVDFEIQSIDCDNVNVFYDESELNETISEALWRV